MNNIENQLTELRLHGVKSSWKSLIDTRRIVELTLSEGLEILLQAELQDRENRRFDRLCKAAKFRYQASLEELNYGASRGLDKAMVSTLSTGNYIQKGEAVLITGATGCGKSFVSSALGHHACTQGYKVLYFNVQKLMQQTKLARVEGTIHQLMQKISKADLLLLDDFGLTHMGKQHQMDLLEIIEDRHAKSATIIVSQLPVSNWFDVIGEATIADAILDRLVHTSYKIELKGESLRRKV
ncbi:MAG: IS21-like element helper ATPase IstB [Bacteroidales bacterium]